MVIGGLGSAVPDKRLLRVRMGFCIAVVVALALVMSLLASPQVTPVTPDSCCYITGAISMVAGQGYRGLMGETQTLFPPGYSAATAIAYKVTGDGTTAGRAVSVLASALTVIPLMLLAWRLFGVWTSVFSGLFYALLPLRLQISNMVWSESLYLLLLMSGLWLWLLETEHASLVRSAAAGLLFGVAYLTRPEGVLAAGVLWLLTVPLHRRWAAVRWKSAIVFALVMAVLVLPYMAFLHKHTGRWSLSSKTDMNLRYAVIRSYDLPWELVSNMDDTVETKGQFARRFLHNVRVETRELQNIVGPFLLAMLVLGCCAELLRRDGRPASAAPSLIVLALPLAYMPVFYIEPRYVYPVSTAAIIFGVWQILKRFSGEGPEPGNSRRSIAVLLPLTVVMVISFVQPDIALIRGPRADDSARKIGAWLQGRVEPEQMIMSNDAVSAFYAGRRRIQLPYADLAGTVEAADRSEVDYLVVSGSDYLTPEMSGILNGSRVSARLRRAGEWSDGSDRRVVLFRVSGRQDQVGVGK